MTNVLAPGAEQPTVDTYRSTAASVAAQLVTLRATDASVYASAQNVMSQGQALWNTVKTNHRCT